MAKKRRQSDLGVTSSIVKIPRKKDTSSAIVPQKEFTTPAEIIKMFGEELPTIKSIDLPGVDWVDATERPESAIACNHNHAGTWRCPTPTIWGDCWVSSQRTTCPACG
ncbi:hypothetical protein CC86DRAFT_380619 [Ophiobolus disseminans]|uniref:Uncharacterized protein n=1 Tax=Ophiobolus disseminans TaxID=1469910 RepID=A0A6A7A7M2_9PLEO|nr:hypothetical protein CC86DRAFT_380619 [Ophiobolus disseminans]